MDKELKNNGFEELQTSLHKVSKELGQIFSQFTNIQDNINKSVEPILCLLYTSDVYKRQASLH